MARFHFTKNYREVCWVRALGRTLYNHDSPWRDSEYVTRKLRSHGAGIKLGTLDAFRDSMAARDHLQAIWQMLEQNEPEDYVLVTGKQYFVREFSGEAFSHLRLNYRDYVEVDLQLLRPVDVQALLGDATKARQR